MSKVSWVTNINAFQSARVRIHNCLLNHGPDHSSTQSLPPVRQSCSREHEDGRWWCHLCPTVIVFEPDVIAIKWHRKKLTFYTKSIDTLLMMTLPWLGGLLSLLALPLQDELRHSNASQTFISVLAATTNLVPRIEVWPQCAREKHRVLRYDGQPLTEEMQAHGANVFAVDQDGAAVGHRSLFRAVGSSFALLQ